LVPFVDLNYELTQYCMVSRYYLVLVDMFTVSWQPYNTYCLYQQVSMQTQWNGKETRV